MNNLAKKEEFIWLDLLRGLSALIVVIGHLRALSFVTYQNVKTTSVFQSAFYFISSGFGSMAVLVFFVLSGFFIVRSIDSSNNKGTWSAGKYCIDRLSRLYTVLIPALIITLIFDIASYYFAGNAPFFNAELPHLTNVNPVLWLSLPNFVGCILFLQTIFVDPFGSNGPLWSLSYEFWYYVLFPLLYFGLKPKTNLWTRVICLFFFFFIATTIWIQTDKLITYFGIWLMGGASYFLYKKNMRIPFHGFATVMAALLLTLCMILGRLRLTDLIYTDFLVGISASILIYLLTKYNSTYITTLAKFLSKISYTLYLVHFPLLAFLTSVLGFYNQEFSINSLLGFAGILIFTVFFSYIFWWTFERNTPVVRNWMFTISDRTVSSVKKI